MPNQEKMERIDESTAPSVRLSRIRRSWFGVLMVFEILKKRRVIKKNGRKAIRESDRFTDRREDTMAETMSRSIGMSKGVVLNLILPSRMVLMPNRIVVILTAEARRICFGRMKASVDALRKKLGRKRRRTMIMARLIFSR